MKLLVLDGNSILNRAFYGIKLLTTKEGQFTNAIYGFLTMLEKLKSESAPDAVAIAFDLKAPTFRHLAYAGYKAQRKGMPEELAQQLQPLKDLLTHLGYRLVECEGFEADDILGTFARVCRENGDECVIATGDRDSLQLVGGGVTVRQASTKMGQPQATVYDAEKIREEYGVEPQQLIEIKALQGDTSDNIPGVAGIGPKGAGELIRRFHDVAYLYDHLDALDIKEGVRQKLAASKENALLSRYLGAIRTDAPIDTTLSDYVPRAADPEAARLMARLELFTLMEKLNLHADAAMRAEGQAPPAGALALTEASGATPDAVSRAAETCLAPVYADGSIQALYFTAPGALFHTVDETLIRTLLSDGSIRKTVHDVKPLYAAMLRQGAEPAGIALDTMLAAYLLNPSSNGYAPDRLAQEYAVQGPSLQEAGDQPQEARQAREAALLPALAERLSAEIEAKGQTKLLEAIELPLARVLAKMEAEGFAVNSGEIEKFGLALDQKARELEQQIPGRPATNLISTPPSSSAMRSLSSWGCPTAKRQKPATPPTRMCWRACALSTRWWTWC